MSPPFSLSPTKIEAEKRVAESSNATNTKGSTVAQAKHTVQKKVVEPLSTAANKAKDKFGTAVKKAPGQVKAGVEKLGHNVKDKANEIQNKEMIKNAGKRFQDVVHQVKSKRK
ncbi:hypothetical protein CHUAL_006269 [Chamberlinius hualienensis]